MTALTRLGFASVDDPDREGAFLRDVTLDGVGIEEAVLGPGDDVTPTGIQSPPSWDRPAYLRSLIDEGPSLVEDMTPGRVAILCCSARGDPWCGYVGARIEMTDEHVLWTDVRFEYPPGMPEAVPSGIGSRLRRLLGRARPEDLEPWRPEAAMPNVEIAFERGAYEDAVRRELAAAERAAPRRPEHRRPQSPRRNELDAGEHRSDRTGGPAPGRTVQPPPSGLDAR